MTNVAIAGRVHVRGRWHVVELAGELDCATVCEAETVLRRFPLRVGDAVVVDLLRVTFLDCAALHLLSRTRVRVLAQGGTFHVVCAGAWPRRILRLGGLLDVLRPVASTAELGMDEPGTKGPGTRNKDETVPVAPDRE
ncbi:STAS domain-containing protein [Streptomyces sp. SID3343]|uniref:STAS domain-containing protein n=1 Tax=Streptomyces sp. SID3343 TaxID=2690260 RepID=UPI00136E0054|nr:STAS domain-containing protein [Streptomyces sp. SID3343]MYW05445.1 STAS domain-containing protein [Streptomyces sp. SID3343]